MRSALKRRVREALSIAAVTIAIGEIGLRLLPFAVDDPLRSLIREAQRIPLSNARTYGGTRVLLPPVVHADVVIVGDSFPFGTYVRESDTFAALLARSTGTTIVNLAVGSQSPQQYQRMVELAVRYHPSLVIYCVFANDFTYAGNVVPRTLSDDVPFGGRPEDEALYLEAPRWADRVERVGRQLSNASVINLLRKLMSQPAATHQSVRWQRDDLSYAFASAAYWDSQIDWNTPAVQRGTALNATFIENADRFLRAHGSRLLVVLEPSKEMVYGPVVGDAIYRGSHYQTYLELAARLSNSGVAVVDLTPALRNLGANHQLFHTIDGHWNEPGHRAVADILQPMVAAP